MHTKHCTKSQGRESKENEITLGSPYLLAPSSGYNIEIHFSNRTRLLLEQSLERKNLGKTILLEMLPFYLALR